MHCYFIVVVAHFTISFPIHFFVVVVRSFVFRLKNMKKKKVRRHCRQKLEVDAAHKDAEKKSGVGNDTTKMPNFI